MNAQLINGKEISQNLYNHLRQATIELKNTHSLTPKLVVIIVGDDPASQIYVKNKKKRALELGYEADLIALPEKTSQNDLLDHIQKLNNDRKTHGILIQLPLPKHINTDFIIRSIAPEKDVDGLHPLNLGLLWSDTKNAVKTGNIPCTPYGCLHLLKKLDSDLTGKKAIIIGRSVLVGKPMAALLLNENCTVKMAHSRTENIEQECLHSDIIVSAVGIPHLVQGSWVKKGAIIIDVGINRVESKNGQSKIVGDVDFKSAEEKASYITPVPGGVGPMTIACLMRNTFLVACKQNNINIELEY